MTISAEWRDQGKKLILFYYSILLVYSYDIGNLVFLFLKYYLSHLMDNHFLLAKNWFLSRIKRNKLAPMQTIVNLEYRFSIFWLD